MCKDFSQNRKRFYVGTASWSIPPTSKELFPKEGSHLQRYASLLSAVEINSCFYKSHRGQTYERWSQSVPSGFKFSVKMAKRITHELELDVSQLELKEALSGPLFLADKLGVILLQLAPSNAFRKQRAEKFFANLRNCFQGPVVLEARHPSWSSKEAINVAAQNHIAYVLADPQRIPDVDSLQLGDFRYLRLHGSPEIYKSPYTEDTLRMWVKNKIAIGNPDSVWCIFDNTSFGHATVNALELQAVLGSGSEFDLKA